MNLQNLIDQFRIEVADKATPSQWSDDEVTLYLNEAEEEAAVRARLIRDKSNLMICQINVTAGVSSYALDPVVCEIVYASMVNAGSIGAFPYRLGITTSDELDQYRPAWRSLKYRPAAIIHYDNTMEVDCIPDTAYTINLEVYRLPLNPMMSGSDTPEINGVHHRHLIKWAKHRAYQKQDADTQDLAKSEKFAKEFEDKFGLPVDATYRKHANSSRPHRNQLY